MTATVKVDIPAQHPYLAVLGAAVAAFVELLGDAALAYGIQLAVHEVCANIIDHAYADVAGVSDFNRIIVNLTGETGQVVAEVWDNGRVFDPQALSWSSQWAAISVAEGTAYRLSQVTEPGVDQDRGRGMYLIHQLVDEVVYVSLPDQNKWRLTRKWPGGVEDAGHSPTSA